MFPAVVDSADRSRTRSRLALALWIVLILLASGDVFSYRNTDAVLRRVDPEPFSHDQIVGMRAVIHLIEYGVLGLLAYRALRAPGPRPAARVATLALALGICLAVSATDESIQAFHPHRSGSPRDVVLDLFGSSLGVAAAALLPRRPRRARPED